MKRYSVLVLLWFWTFAASADESDLHNGIAAYRAGHYDTATQHFTAAVFAASNDTERARTLHNLGNSYFQQGDYAAAAQVFRDALTYRTDHTPTQQNLAIALEIQAELERRLAVTLRTETANDNDSGARRERNTNALDWDQTSTLTLGEGKDTPINTPPPDLPPDFNQLVEKGMARLAETGATDPQTWRKNRQSLDDARIALQQLDDDPTALWKRLLEVEEGYPAPQTTPNELPGMLPW